jgi:hypothetical protein
LRSLKVRLFARNILPQMSSFGSTLLLVLMDLFSLFRGKLPKLAADAYPTIFPNLPSYLSQLPHVKRKTPDDRSEELFVRSEQLLTDWLQNDKVTTYADLSGYIDTFIKDYSNWTVVKGADHICLCWINVIGTPRLHVVIRFAHDLHVDVFIGELKLDDSTLEWDT